jgi:membrane protein YqaA with SNARE-associated domain
MDAFLLTFACIFAVNLLPAFGPPTWALLVFFKLEYDLPIVPMILGAALCAASGRLVLAHASRRLRHRLSPRRREHLNAAAEALTGDRRRSAGALGLFALSPVPSAQLFVAAGLLDLRLLRLTAAFFAGRLISYATYVSGAALAQDSLSDVLRDAFASPVGIALQIAMLVALIAMLRIDWASRFARHRPDGGRADDAFASARDSRSSDVSRLVAVGRSPRKPSAAIRSSDRRR